MFFFTDFTFRFFFILIGERVSFFTLVGRVLVFEVSSVCG